MTTPQYSSLFSCLHDEPAPVGQIGRGAHYSVMRCVEWRNVSLEPFDYPLVHDFATIWDEDHDTRVIQAIEAIYMEGLLAPVLFIGERKGTLNIVLSSQFFEDRTQAQVDEYVSRIETINEGFEDYWPVSVDPFDPRSDSGSVRTLPIIQDSPQKVDAYLRNINNLWSLGLRPFAQENARAALKPTQPNVSLFHPELP